MSCLILWLQLRIDKTSFPWFYGHLNAQLFFTIFFSEIMRSSVHETLGHSFHYSPKQACNNCTVKPVLNGHSKEEIFKTDNHLNLVKSIAECSPAIL